MATVEQILNGELPRPTFTYRPGLATPKKPEMVHDRPDAGATGRVARTLDPRTSRLKALSSDKPRIYGSQQGLRIGPQATELAHYSASPANWNDGSAGQIGADRTSIFEGKTAKVLTGTSGNDDVLVPTNEAMQADHETYRVIFETGEGASKFRIRLQEETNFNSFAFVTIDLSSTPTIDSTSNLVAANLRIRNLSPNDGTVVDLTVRYDPGALGVDGRGVRPRILPDENGGTNGVIAHYFGRRKRTDFGTPIATGGASSKTKGGDKLVVYSGGPPKWFNQDQGTWYGEMIFTKWSYGPDNPHYIYTGNKSFLVDFMSTPQDPPFRFINYDGNDRVTSPNVIEPFEKTKFAVSITPNERRLAVNGTVRTNVHNGSLLSGDAFNLRLSPNGNVLWNTLRYYPVAFPASPSTRSAYEPLSVKTITS